MSELNNTNCNNATIRWQLLATASVIALLGSVYGVDGAWASDDADRPTVWVELGGQLSRVDETQEPFVPPVMANRPSSLSPSQPFEKLPLYSMEETGKISIEPRGTDWTFSASVRYGRSSNKRDIRQQTNPKTLFVTVGTNPPFAKYPVASKFADTAVSTDEQHLVVDFQVGKDVGLGLLGHHSGSSTLNLGVRFAQFVSKSNIALKSDPDWHFSYHYKYGLKTGAHQPYHSNIASLRASRSFHGIGPSISWNASEPVLGNTHEGELAVDWGLNAAIVFGRQRAFVHHQASGHYRGTGLGAFRQLTYAPPAVDRTRSRNVRVPNIGGFAGATYRMDNFKMSAGYRADFFFGAMDGGIDSRTENDIGFFGPFATVSIGLGG